MERFLELKQVIETIQADAEKFYQKGNGAAGTRLRKAMLELKKHAQDVRFDIGQRKRKQQ